MKLPIVVLDAGHGGHDSGALGPSGLKESDMALDICLRAKRLLRGILDARLTRETDIFLNLSERPAIANVLRASAFVSYHFNSGSSQNTASSWEVFTTPGQNQSDVLATCIGEEHAKLPLGQSARTDMSDGDLDKEANFAVIRATNCPSCLMEGELIHTRHGEALIKNPANRELMALAVARGLCKFLGVPFIAPEPIITSPISAPLTLEERVSRLESKVFRA